MHRDKISKEVMYINRIINKKRFTDKVIIAWLMMYNLHIKHKKVKIISFRVISKEYMKTAHHYQRIYMETPDSDDVHSVSLYRFKKFCRSRKLSESYRHFSIFQMPHIRFNDRLRKEHYYKNIKEKIYGIEN